MIQHIRRAIGERIFLPRVENMLSKFQKHIHPQEKILDLGSGTCLFSRLLTEKGYNITSVDISNKSYYQDVKPIVYDGNKLPFEDNSFDTCMLIAVLHHTPDPAHILTEVSRVAKKIILLEDIYTNQLQKYYTFVVDSVLNKEFIGHPHSNKTDAEWKKLFEEKGLRLTYTDYYNSWGYLLNSIYVVER